MAKRYLVTFDENLTAIQTKETSVAEDKPRTISVLAKSASDAINKAKVLIGGSS